jgi:PAS domain S-box-containing protein
MYCRLFDPASYMANPLAVQTLVVALVVFSVGVFALYRMRKSPVSTAFFLVMLAVSEWLSAFSWVYSTTDEQLAMWWAKAGYIGVCFIPAAVSQYITAIVQDYDKVRKRLPAVWIISSLFMALILSTDMQFSSLLHYSWGFYPNYGITSTPFLLFFFGVMIDSMRRFLRGYRKIRKGSAQSKAARELLVGIIVGYFASIDYCVGFGVTLYPLGYIPILLLAVISTRSILRYRLTTITPAFAARQIIDTMNDALIVLDCEGDVRLVNQMACNMFGCSEEQLVGNLPTRSMTGNREFAVVLESLVQGEAVRNLELEYYRTEENAPGTLSLSASIIPDQAGAPLSVVCVARDVTRQKRLEEELLKSQKLESLGVLAGGIAHDFNNILTAILGNVSLARMRSDPADKIYKWLKDAEKASARAKDLTHQLLTFSKGGAPVKSVISLEHSIRDSTGFALRGANVKCDFRAADGLWPVEADEGQMIQVFNNLIINACQAMPDGGEIKIAASNVIIDANNSLPLTVGKYVKISLADQGTGIPDKYLHRIFDPYFTTKQKGSGLGLAVTYSIVKNHGGYIKVESEAGSGTAFTIYLPASDNSMEELKTTEELIVAGKGKILLMDDDEMVRTVGREMLVELGYSVETARDGAEAIEAFSKAKEAGKFYDAVVLDLTIPGGMGGKEVIKIVREMDPSVTAIVSSGYSNDPVMANFTQYGFNAVVSKPYKVNELDRVLRGTT